MNKRLEHETGEKLFKKRGWKWALTRFAFDVWVREAPKKQVECKLEEELVNRLDSAAEILHATRTDLTKTACITYLKSIKR